MRALVTNVNPQPDDLLQGSFVFDSPGLLESHTNYPYKGQYYRTVATREPAGEQVDFIAEVELDKDTEDTFRNAGQLPI